MSSFVSLIQASQYCIDSVVQQYCVKLDQQCPCAVYNQGHDVFLGGITNLLKHSSAFSIQSIADRTQRVIPTAMSKGCGDLCLDLI